MAGRAPRVPPGPVDEKNRWYILVRYPIDEIDLGMRCISSYGIGCSSSVRTLRAVAVGAARFSHLPLSLGLSVFHARLAQLSTRDLACLS
jgi:hypothetical protein